MSIVSVAKSKISRMNYADFDKAITEKHGIVCEGWPLQKFCSPSDLKCKNEVQVLFNAWSQGSARFRLLSNKEWEEWSNAQFQRQLAVTTGPAAEHQEPGAELPVNEATIIVTEPSSTTPAIADGDPVTNSEVQPGPASEPSLQPEAACNPPVQSILPGDPDALRSSKRARISEDMAFVNTGVTDRDGNAVVIPGRKPRKQRSDKGKPRGPRKGKENMLTLNSTT